MRAGCLAAIAAALGVVALAGCHSTATGHLPDGASLGDDLSAEGGDLAGADLAGVDADLGEVELGCTPQITTCTGLCGPVYDACLGRDVQCGTCPNGTVCDLVSHTCGVPKTDCASLGAQCGIVRNSCGTRLQCPDCAAGTECNPDSNQCVACTNPTCAELGYQCGLAWLGCGPRTASGSQVDCGGCPSGLACNLFNHLCEPICTAPSAATLCAQAKTSLGVECGDISDGCGSTVNCGGCAAGFGCGAQGDPNRCGAIETPVECVAAGRNCGTLTSACGGSVNCGTCTPPNVCNANGVCGPPCTPLTCVQLGNPQCGAVPDGCGGNKTCNFCPTPQSAYACINNQCCKKKTSTDYQNAGQCGTGLSDGCGSTVSATCPSGQTCVQPTPGMPGTCCTNTASCGTSCNTSVTNTCTGQPIACTCDGTHYCSGNTCVPKKTCASYGATGADGATCSNGPSFDDGTGNLLTCGCGGLPHYCVTPPPPSSAVSGATRGVCCTDTSACNYMGTHCNTSAPNACLAGITDTCGACSSSSFCNGSNLCQPKKTCASYISNPGPGQPGAVCSNGANPAWPVGDGTDLTCPCSAGSTYCKDGGGTVVSGSTTGTCCVNMNLCANNVCTDVDCGGKTVSCCSSSQYCDGTGHCATKQTCQSLGKTGLPSPPQATASGCNDNNFYSDGNPSDPLFPCHCSTANGYTNDKCVGDTTTVEGTCQCTASTCGSCADNGTSNGCGGTRSCPCGAGTVCYNAACCTPYSCTSLPPGVPGTTDNPACGAYNDHCGSSFSCGCPASNPATGQPWANVQCTTVSGQTYGTCTCTPTPCTVLGAGNHANDGCGNPVNCGG